MMKKQEFSLTIMAVVREVKLVRPFHSSRWSMAVESANRNGFTVNPNKSIEEDRVLAAILAMADIPEIPNLSEVVLLWGYLEDAWEYYQKQASLPATHEQ